MSLIVKDRGVVVTKKNFPCLGIHNAKSVVLSHRTTIIAIQLEMDKRTVYGMKEDRDKYKSIPIQIGEISEEETKTEWCTLSELMAGPAIE